MKPQCRKPLATALNTDAVGHNVRAWIEARASDGEWLVLAHADDGVIWGRIDAGSLVVPAEHQAQLRAETLQQCRVFNQDAEILLWRGGDDSWYARMITDSEDKDELALDEEQMLWGTKMKQSPGNGFTLVQDGAEGLAHAVPRDLSDADFRQQQRPLRLRVRHYLETDTSTGLVRIASSRLVELVAPKGASA